MENNNCYGGRMENLAKKLEEIVEDFIEKRVPVETKQDFIIAAIHFNINLNTCSKYDLMRIDRKARDLANAEQNEILTTASIYSYILYREINTGEIPSEDKLKVKIALMGISTTITDYLTYRIDENTLNNSLYTELTSLGV